MGSFRESDARYRYDVRISQVPGPLKAGTLEAGSAGFFRAWRFRDTPGKRALGTRNFGTEHP